MFNMNIKIIDYQYGYAEFPINGTKVKINNKQILDIDGSNDVDNRVEILKAVLKHFNIDTFMDVD